MDIPDAVFPLSEDIPDSGIHALEGNRFDEGAREVRLGMGEALECRPRPAQLRRALSRVWDQSASRLHMASSLSGGQTRLRRAEGAHSSSAHQPREAP